MENDTVKIESSSVQKPSHNTQATAAKLPEKPSVEAQKNQHRTDASSVHERILYWFSQVGVGTTKINQTHSPKAKNLDERLQRKQQLLELRQYNNLQTILDKALQFSPEHASAAQLDPDWFFSFINMAEQVHAPAMQELWGKIFAVESSRPGSFSLRTLKLLTQITQREAKLLSIAVSLSSRQPGAHNPKIIIGYNRKPGLLSFFRIPQIKRLNLSQFGLSYPNTLSLMDLGLIYNSEIESAEYLSSAGVTWRNGTDTMTLTAKRSGIVLTYYKFTVTGMELARLVNGEPNAEYVNSLRTLLSAEFTIS